MDRRWLLWGALLLAAAACALPTTGGDSKSAEAIQTQVAATLTALAPAEATQAGVTPTEPAEQPSPTPLPLVSPGEAAVVYTDAGQPWFWTADSGPQQLSPADRVEDVLISDDGQLVVFIRREASDQPQPVEVRVVQSDGSGEQVLLTPDDFDALHPTQDFPHNDLSEIGFIPGSHSLLFNTRGLPEGPGLARYNDLLRLDADSGEFTTLLPAEQGGDFVASPDGSKMAVIRPDSVSMAQIDGSMILADAITYQPIITYSEFQYTVKPVWKADSSGVFVAVPSEDPLADQTSGAIWWIPADGSPAVQRGTIDGSFYFPQLSGDSLVSPALEVVAFLRGSNNDYDLHLANLDGGSGSVYDSGNLDWRGWSPDGSQFVYLSREDGILYRGIPGEAPYGLVTGSDLSWLDSDSFVFLQGSIGNWSLYRGWTEAGDPQLIAQPTGDFISYDVTVP